MAINHGKIVCINVWQWCTFSGNINAKSIAFRIVWQPRAKCFSLSILCCLFLIVVSNIYLLFLVVLSMKCVSSITVPEHRRTKLNKLKEICTQLHGWTSLNKEMIISPLTKKELEPIQIHWMHCHFFPRIPLMMIFFEMFLLKSDYVFFSVICFFRPFSHFVRHLIEISIIYHDILMRDEFAIEFAMNSWIRFDRMRKNRKTL